MHEPIAIDLNALQALGESLAKKRRKAIDGRIAAGIDRRWFEDVEAYEGRDEFSRALLSLRDQVQGYVQTDTDKKKRRSTLVVNVIRSKVNAAAARLSDIALPSDDRNWDLRPSTVPELVEQTMRTDVGITHMGQPVMIDDGQGGMRQATAADLARQTMEEAKRRAGLMRDEIDDQLDQSEGGCGYEGVVRQVIEDAALLGVGIIKGPVITSRTRRAWIPLSDGRGGTVHVLTEVRDLKPMSSRVDPWDFYPDPECGENVKKGSHVFERIRVSAAELRRLVDVPGYIVENIVQALREGPKHMEQSDKPGEEKVVTEDSVFELWEYHGDLDASMLRAAGVPVDESDVLTTVRACVVMVNDRVIKADRELLDTGDLPYDVFVWEKASGIWAGYGVARLARSASRAITAAWRAMMDNAGQTVGPQIVIKRHAIDPADGEWEIYGHKIWLDNTEEDVRGHFAVYEISSHQAEFQAIIQLGLKFLDEETSLPMLVQGEKGTAPDRVGVAQILINSANTVLRKKLKQFDDQVTIPHIRRYVDWNMQYNPRPDIKGDFEVQARASGALFERDVQNQAAASLLQLASNPAYAHGIKKWEAVRRVVQALRFDPNDFVEDDETIQQREQQMAQGGPQVSPADELRAKTELEIARMKLDAEREARQWQERQKQIEMDHEIKKMDIELRVRMLEYASRNKLTLDQVKAKLAETVIKERGANARLAAEAQLRRQTGAGV